MFQLDKRRVTGVAAEVEQGAVCVRKAEERGAIAAKHRPPAPLAAGPVPPGASASPEMPPQQPSPSQLQHPPPARPAPLPLRGKGLRGCGAAEPLWAMSALPTCGWARPGSAGLGWARLGPSWFGGIRLGSPLFGSAGLALVRLHSARLSGTRLLSGRSIGPAPPETRARWVRRDRWSGGWPVGAGAVRRPFRPPPTLGRRRHLDSGRPHAGPASAAGPGRASAGLSSPPHPGAPGTSGGGEEQRALAGRTPGACRGSPLYPVPVAGPTGLRGGGWAGGGWGVASPGARGQQSSRGLGRDSWGRRS